MKAIKVTNPEWLPEIGEQINDFCKKTALPGLHGPNLFAHIAYDIIQRGGDVAEFYVVFNEDQPIAFAEWMMMALPNVGKVYMPYLHTWKKERACFSMLLKEFIKFGERHRAVWYVYDPLNEKLHDILKLQLKKNGHKLIDSKIIHCLSRREK
jgi:hypothetical protein